VNEKEIILCKKISRYQELNCKKIKTQGTKAGLPNITAVLPLRISTVNATATWHVLYCDYDCNIIKNVDYRLAETMKWVG